MSVSVSVYVNVSDCVDECLCSRLAVVYMFCVHHAVTDKMFGLLC